MTNYEFHKDAIESLYRVGASFGLSERNVVAMCSNIGCTKCMFSLSHNPCTEGLSCGDRKMLWALKEYVVKPKLTKREKKFVDVMGADMYLARDADDVLHLFNQKPVKSMLTEDWMADGYHFNMYFFHNCDFSFIKWEDAKPWDVTMLSQLPVEE